MYYDNHIYLVLWKELLVAVHSCVLRISSLSQILPRKVSRLWFYHHCHLSETKLKCVVLFDCNDCQLGFMLTNVNFFPIVLGFKKNYSTKIAQNRQVWRGLNGVSLSLMASYLERCLCTRCSLCNARPLGHWSWKSGQHAHLEVVKCVLLQTKELTKHPLLADKLLPN